MVRVLCRWAVRRSAEGRSVIHVWVDRWWGWWVGQGVVEWVAVVGGRRQRWAGVGCGGCRLRVESARCGVLLRGGVLAEERLEDGDGDSGGIIDGVDDLLAVVEESDPVVESAASSTPSALIAPDKLGCGFG